MQERCARLCRQRDRICVADRRSPARSTHQSARQLGGTGENGHSLLADWTLCSGDREEEEKERKKKLEKKKKKKTKTKKKKKEEEEED